MHPINFFNVYLKKSKFSPNPLILLNIKSREFSGKFPTPPIEFPRDLRPASQTDLAPPTAEYISDFN